MQHKGAVQRHKNNQKLNRKAQMLRQANEMWTDDRYGLEPSKSVEKNS